MQREIEPIGRGHAIVRVVVADAGARYPVTVDPVYTTASSTITGAAGVNLGMSVSSAGDVNNDGYDDVIVGAPAYGSNTGRAYVYKGSATGVSSTVSTTLTGESASYFGYSVSGAGDVNNDGYDDVIVGAYAYSISTGRAYVYHGSSTGTLGTATTTLTGPSGSYFGLSVSGAGDVNNDGYDDIIVGAYYYSSGTGRAYVHHGSTTGVSTTATTTITGTSASSLGKAVSGAGDINNDGYDDVIVGAPNYASGAGLAYVYKGSSTGVSSTASTALVGSTGSLFGTSVSRAGDVNGDGYDDVIVGASSYSSYTGRAYVYLGSSTVVSSTVSTQLTGTAASYFGASVSGAGDIDADGYDDVIVGAYGASTAYVYRGSSTGVSSTATSTLVGSSSIYYANAVSGAGDVNNDGYDDVIVGAWYYSSGAGRAYVHHGYADSDGDGSAAGTDCNDASASIYPGAVEIVADGIDQECDGVDSCYTDGDGDNYGTTVVTDGSSLSCATGTGAAVSTDCDDGDAAVNPAGSETVADGVDQDCDSVDACYTDADGDNYGTTVVIDGSSLSCATGTGAAVSTDCDDAVATTFPGAAPLDSATGCMNDDDGDDYGDASTSRSVTAGSDCDDAVGATHPGAAETVADGVDQDCDSVDSCYTDADGDNYGTAVVTDGSSLSCATGSGAAVATDCDDGDGAINPAGSEAVADGVDQDCDSVDACYTDVDGDNYGTAVVIDGSSLSCSTGTGAPIATDCDDALAAVNPGASEVCDASNVDEDCDGLADDADASASGKTSLYPDADADGYGSSTGVAATYCDAPASGYAASATDCDDGSAAVHPGATEVCDGADADEDCDGLADDADASVASSSRTTFYVDADGDSFGSTTSAAYCDEPATGYAAVATDCDDAASAVYPGAPETTGDGVDGDCDGGEVCYVDVDADGYRPDSGTVASADSDCADSGEATSSVPAGDCADDSPSVHPGAVEITGDEVDEDCDSGETCFVDADLDGARGATTTASADVDCTGAGEATASAAVDCDDADPGASPAATEITGSGVDEDCDGAELCYVDADGDGYRPDETSTVASSDADCDDPGEARVSALTGDCDDTPGTGVAYNPAALETDCADPADYNCDGSATFDDADSDGFAACEDCDDGDAAVYPGAPETPADGVDGDCDGVDLCWVDADDDGYRPDIDTSVEGASVACDGPFEASELDPSGDCDDTDASANPAAVEAAGDGVDANCDGAETCFVDADGDAAPSGDGATVASADTDCADFGEALAGAADCDDTDAAYHPGAPEGDCSDPGDYNCDGSSGFVDADADGFAACEECDDTDATVSPAETEICNDRDDDCNGTTDDAAVDASTWYADADSDGYTNPDVAVVECDAPAGYAAATDDDCDDADSASFPGAADTPDDGVDQDCSGADATDTGDTGPADDTGADDTSADDTGADETSADDTGAGDTSADDTGADDTSSDDTAIDDRATDDTGTGKDPGCGCATAGDVGPAGALLLLGAALAARRRRA